MTPEQRREYNREYYKKNANKICEYNREYNKKNADKIRKKEREWREKNVDKLREYNREYDKKNPGKTRKRMRNYYNRNLEQQLEKSRIRVSCLDDVYVQIQLRKQYGLTDEQITPELIQMKREQLTKFRLLKEIKKGMSDE